MALLTTVDVWDEFFARLETAKVIRHLPPRDGEDPGTEGIGGIEVGNLATDLDEDFLKDVVSIGIAPYS